MTFVWRELSFHKGNTWEWDSHSSRGLTYHNKAKVTFIIKLTYNKAKLTFVTKRPYHNKTRPAFNTIQDKYNYHDIGVRLCACTH